MYVTMVPIKLRLLCMAGLKESLFNVYLLRDASHLLISTALILVAIWVYTGSLTLTMASLSSILLSLGQNWASHICTAAGGGGFRHNQSIKYHFFNTFK